MNFQRFVEKFVEMQQAQQGSTDVDCVEVPGEMYSDMLDYGGFKFPTYEEQVKHSTSNERVLLGWIADVDTPDRAAVYAVQNLRPNQVVFVLK